MRKVISLLLTSLLLSGACHAGHGKEGGDPLRGRKEMLAKNFVNLKQDLESLLPYIYSEIKDAQLIRLLARVDKQELIDDIRLSPYSMSEKCSDSLNQDHGASTYVGLRNAPVCFDLNELTAQKTTQGELVGLALHEHFHHFSLVDSPELDLLIAAVSNIKNHKVEIIIFELKQLVASFTPLKPEQIKENVKIQDRYIARELLGNFANEIKKKYGSCALGVSGKNSLAHLGQTINEITIVIMNHCYGLEVLEVVIQSKDK